MRPVHVLVGAALLAASGPLLAGGAHAAGGALFLGGVLAAGYGTRDAFGFRARSRTVQRALAEASLKARPRIRWPTIDPRHPRLAEAWRALRTERQG